MIREYRCPTCGIVEQQCNMADDPLTVCPNTGCFEPIKRIISPVAHTWKCDGFAGKGFANTGKRVENG